jgi:hypothetical protein
LLTLEVLVLANVRHGRKDVCKPATLGSAQRSLKDLSMRLFSAPTLRGCALLQGPHQVVIQISHHQLGHGPSPIVVVNVINDSGARRESQSLIATASGRYARAARARIACDSDGFTVCAAAQARWLSGAKYLGWWRGIMRRKPAALAERHYRVGPLEPMRQWHEREQVGIDAPGMGDARAMRRLRVAGGCYRLSLLTRYVSILP